MFKQNTGFLSANNYSVQSPCTTLTNSVSCCVKTLSCIPAQQKPMMMVSGHHIHLYLHLRGDAILHDHWFKNRCSKVTRTIPAKKVA